MHPGSGQSDRSNDGLFEPLADHLLTHGIAIAWFDKRGVGGSGGALADAGIVEQAADLCAALDAVRSEIGSLPIGVFGHSQGGLVVVEAAQTVSPAFVISQSGPAVSPNTQEAFSTATRLRRARWDEQRITRAVDQVRVALQRAVDGGPWDDQVKWYAERRDDVEELIEIGAFVAADPERGGSSLGWGRITPSTHSARASAAVGDLRRGRPGRAGRSERADSRAGG